LVIRIDEAGMVVADAVTVEIAVEVAIGVAVSEAVIVAVAILLGTLFEDGVLVRDGIAVGDWDGATVDVRVGLTTTVAVRRSGRLFFSASDASVAGNKRRKTEHPKTSKGRPSSRRRRARVSSVWRADEGWGLIKGDSRCGKAD
jgi:hypothetical protein